MRWWVTVGIACAVGCSPEYVVPGGGDANRGDSSQGDPGTGDPGSGDPGTGDPAVGDSGTGDPGAGDPGSGDPGTGDPGVGDSGAGAGDPGGDDLGAGDPGVQPCPTIAPVTGNGCTQVGLQCAYGDDPRDGCRVIATCDGTWSVFDPACADAPIDLNCPATVQEATGTSCTTGGNYCFYGSYACLCTNCPPSASLCGGEFLWWCELPHPDTECPADRPLLGTPCPLPDKVCEYVCGTDGAVVCTDGTWHGHTASSCPISSRRFKQNIDYLGAAELARLAEQLLAVRLAEYEYIQQPADRRLGFITEDHPALPAVGADGASVDLYAYTSMILATVQVQARHIEELEREMERLRAVVEVVEAPVCEPP